VIYFTYLFVLLIGFSFGSFIGALTYRVPRGISIYSKKRSFCPDCKYSLAWYDNIPLLSYLLLGGKCRNCHKSISVREPLIELFTGSLFVLIYTALINCSAVSSSEQICLWSTALGSWVYPLFLFLGTTFMVIFVIDTEHMVIYDELVFFLFTLVAFLLILVRPDVLFLNLFAGFIAGLLLLILNLVTRGRGMGLGDAKLAIVGGLILGWPGSVVWLFLSFIIGAIFGIFLLVTRRVTLGRQIPFGPYLVISFFGVLIFGNIISSLIFQIPY